MPRLSTPPPTILVLLATFLLPLGAAAFEIGQREFTWTDPERGNRQVPGFIYYPAETGGVDAPVAPAPQGGFPVVVLGHGFLMSCQLYDYIPASLVIEGYVVLMPETETGLLPDHLDLGLDMVFLVSRLQELGQEEGSPYFGRVGSRSAALGHSMGGGAALLAAAESSLITTVIGLAPAETNPSAIAACAQMQQPTLLVSGSVDCVAPAADHQTPMFEALGGDCRVLVEMVGGSHCQFAASSVACNLGEGLAGCADPTLSRPEQQELVNRMIRPWLDAKLRESPAAWETFLLTLDQEPALVGQIACDVLSPAIPWATGATFLGAFPNPFNPGTTIRFELIAPTQVSLQIHDLQGRLVRKLVSDHLPAGEYAWPWDGNDQQGRGTASGIYLLRLQAGTEIRQAKLSLIK